MRKSGYMDRAMRSHDPRFARILSKMGYDRRDLRAAVDEAEPDPLDALRAEYAEVIGKRPYHGWPVEVLKARIAEARAVPVDPPAPESGATNETGESGDGAGDAGGQQP